MTSALDAEQRTRLDRLITRARRLLEEDLLDQAAGRFGVDANGTIATENALRLDPTALARRREVIDVVEHLRSEGEDAAGAVTRLLREATFTDLNRLVAIRIAEALKLLPPSLASGRSSQGFRDLLELVPLLAADDTGGYWAYLQLCGDELAADVPALFDPRNPLLTLAPSPGALDDLVDLLADPYAGELWLAPDCLGWVYQFFNTGEERRAMREGSAAPRDSRELAVRNQFFTPRYVVDFLVQNSLGRRLIEADPTSPLLDDLRLIVDPPTEPGEPVILDEVSMLDPACGSGHFLLAGYDVLELAWHYAGVDAASAAPAIIRSLWGIDIDPRCAEVAAAAVIFRARRSCPVGELPHPNIVCARALPATSTGLNEVLAALPDKHRRLVEALTEAMADAPTLGSLLKIDERLATEVRAAAFGAAAPRGTLADAMPEETLRSLEEEVLAALDTVAHATTATPAERLLAAEANDVMRFVHALQRRYDAVCMNPPFGLSIEATRPYIQAVYGPSAADLYAAFVTRGIELLRPHGLVGAITNRSGFFLSSLEEWRRHLLEMGVVTFADLGSFVLEGAQVEVAAYVVGRPTERTTFIRALLERDKPAILARRPAEHTFRVASDDIRRLPGAWFDYWVGDQSLRFFTELPPLESDSRLVSRGISVGDNFRFLRLIWELREDATRRGWKHLSKGGKFSRYYDDIHLLLDWRSGPEPYALVPGARIFNLNLQGRPGVYWPKRTTSLPSARPLPSGTYFEANSIPLFGGDPYLNLAFANTRLFAHLFLMQVGAGDVARGSAAKDWITGPARQIPWSEPPEDLARSIKSLARNAVTEKLRAASEHETSLHFQCPALVRQLLNGRSFDAAVQCVVADAEEREVRCLELEAEIDSLFLVAYGCELETIATLDRELEPQPAALGLRIIESDLFRSAYMTKAALPLQLDTADSRQEARVGRQVEPRSLRDLSLLFGTHPRHVVEQRRELGLLRAEDSEAAAIEFVSYLVGVAVGRWNLAVAHEQSEELELPAPFEALPCAPPAMLTHDAPEFTRSYPMPKPLAGVLFDQVGHERDIADVIALAAQHLDPSAERALQDALKVLGVQDLRVFLRKRFFRVHLAQYSESRRNAPIYWPLYLPSGAWGLWVHATEMNRETLFAIARASADRHDHAQAEIRRLQRERETGGAGRSTRDVANALEAEEKLAEELRRFRDEADRIAGLGWVPDLDDGIILCAAPLADLFPAWKDAAAARRELKAGKYPWASVSKWADQL